MTVTYSKYTPEDIDNFVEYEVQRMGSPNLEYIRRRELYIKWLLRCVTILYVVFLYIFMHRVQYLVLPTSTLVLSILCYMKIYQYCKQKGMYGLHFSTVAEMNKRRVRISPIISDYFCNMYSEFLEMYKLQTLVKERMISEFVSFDDKGLVVKLVRQEDETLFKISKNTVGMLFTDEHTIDFSIMDSEFDSYFEVMNFEKNIFSNE